MNKSILIILLTLYIFFTTMLLTILLWFLEQNKRIKKFLNYIPICGIICALFSFLISNDTIKVLYLVFLVILALVNGIRIKYPIKEDVHHEKN